MILFFSFFFCIPEFVSNQNRSCFTGTQSNGCVRTSIRLSRSFLVRRFFPSFLPHSQNHTFRFSPGLLQTLDDCGSPPLAARAQTLQRATSLRTSDHKSMMAYMGLPLDIFGKDAFFQPYLPLQQMDLLKETKSWLCGCTNSIVTAQKEIDLLVNVCVYLFFFFGRPWNFFGL